MKVILESLLGIRGNDIVNIQFLGIKYVVINDPNRDTAPYINYYSF